MIALGLMLSGLLATEPVCYDGTVGDGIRARRLVLSASEETAEVYVYGRPPRTVRLSASGGDAGTRRYASSDGHSEVTLRDLEADIVTPIAGARIEAVLMRAPSPVGLTPVLGEWITAVGPGGAIRLVVRVQTGPCGLPVGALDSPDQGQADLPLTAVLMQADSLVVEAEYMSLRIALPLLGEDERPGVMVQHGVEHQILLRRSTGAAARRRPQEPSRPYPYAEREVRFAGASPDIVLGGTLTLPEGEGPFPAIVLISGSGPQDRDQTFAGHRSFLVLADHLSRQGYAVLRTDDRGVGASTGNVMRSCLDDIAADVRKAIDHLRAYPAIDGRKIGLLGHSEGGYVAPMVAAQHSSVAFVALLGAPAITGREVLLAQRAALTRADGAAEAWIAVDSSMVAALLRAMDSRPPDDVLEARVQAELDALLDSLSAERRAIADEILAARSSAQDSLSLVLWRSEWFKSLISHDPRPYLRRINVPVLAMLGDLDMQVPVVQNEAAFRSLFEGPRSGLLTFARPAGVNHMLQPARTGAMEEYSRIEETIAPEVLRTLDNWLSVHVPAGARTTNRIPEGSL